MKNYVWQTNFIDVNQQSLTLAQQLQLHPKLSFLLQSRNLTTLEQAANFFTPVITNIHNPLVMKNMDIALARMLFAIQNNQNILVYGDYDVDGTTAVAIMYSFLRKLKCNVDFYVPDRYAEGYGVSMMGIDWAISHNIDLIITLDCGIKAFNTIAYANEHNIDVIVCDHHEPSLELPPAIAILNPKQKDCTYPFKELSGCGVGFKLVQAICESLGLDLRENLYCYLDLLAVSIASDIVPIVDENRIYMYFGLLKMQSKPLVGIRAMLQTAGIENIPLTVSDVVFKIGPRINAAGRIYNAKTAIELLISEEFKFALEICERIDMYNIERREIDKSITQEALQIIESDETRHQKSSNVLYQPHWHKGVIGIVASRIIEYHYKPTIVFCGEGDIITASARSVADFDLYTALEQCKEYLLHFGGHKYAAGMAIKTQDFNSFSMKFDDIVSQNILQEQTIPKIIIDAELEIEDISQAIFDQLQNFAPFGPENMTPMFMIKNLKDSGYSKVVGSDNSHVKLSLCNAINPEVVVEGIGFGLAQKWLELQNVASIDVCFVLKENIFRNKKSIQLEIRDLRASE